jgi:DNA-binding response OmpR family regulator
LAEIFRLTKHLGGSEFQMAMSPSPASSAIAPTHLLVVDDDTEIAQILSRYFGSHGFRVSTAGDGTQMRRVLDSEAVDVVMLDLGLPGEDGFSLTRHLREHWHGPVIIVTGRGESVDRVVGLELGADDYVTKPFELRELLARVRSVLRRTTPPAKAADVKTEHPRRLSFDGYVLDPRSHTLSGPHGEPISLTSGEFTLLGIFMEHANQVLTRDQLMTHIHGRDAGPFDRSIDVQIGRLRRKIELDPARPQRIKSIRGTGYLFSSTVQRI